MPQLISFFLGVLVVPRRRGELVCILSSCYRRRATLDVMSFPRALVISIFLVLLFHADRSASEPAGVFSFIHDLIQYNVAGIPLVHERTEWDFDPEVGKQRSVRYEQENGRHGEIAISKIGMGIGYKGPWGTPV